MRVASVSIGKRKQTFVMLRPVSTLPLSKIAILELCKSSCIYVEDIENSEDWTCKYADKLFSMPTTLSALDLVHEELQRENLTTLCEALDNILEGGIQCGAITEICGAYGSGKTQICLQTSVICQLPKECGGLNAQSLYIDTRNGFSPSRVRGDNNTKKMGIRGLMTYINRNPKFFDSHELHGGYLVIDGHSLAAQLYTSSRCNCAFGGDYDKYAHCVADFFDELIKCEVIPLVILDGGMERKKMKTMYERMSEKLLSATRYTPASQSEKKFMPLAMMIVFKSVLRQKSIKLARCIFEADPGIAGVAKILNCPVLSYDSDFYIFGVQYIPINTLEPFVVKNSQGQGYMKRCKLFRIENLLKTFPGLDSSVLPLAAILLGNDYIESKIFKNFYACLKLSNQNQRLYNEGQRRIHTTLRWLKNYNLNDAVAAILSKLPKKRRQKVLHIIEVIVNGYLVLPFDILIPLGFPEKYKMEMKTRHKIFKFHGNVDTLESRQLWREDQIFTSENSSSDEEEETMEIELENEKNDCNETFANSWPSWFALQHGIADFPCYFVDMMCLRLFTVTTQIEDFKYPSAYSMSLKIVEVIDGLLVADHEKSTPGLVYMIRDGTNFIRRRVDAPVRGTETTIFPVLAKLRDLSINTRKRIIDDTLEISDKEEFFNDIPPQWRLYVATIIYWMQKSDEPSKNSCHMTAILFTMLLGIVDRKIGYQRSLQRFNRAHKATLIEIESKRKNSKLEHAEGEENSIIAALEAVSKDDCLVAAPFFIQNYTMDQQLVECPRKFNVTIVHAFSQFQSCLRHAIHLNVLLGCPYEYPIIAEMYNGTMLYNLYTNFEKRNDIEAYISVVLENSPSFLNIFKLLISRVKGILDEVVVAGNRTRGTKRRRNKKKKKKGDDDEELLIENKIENVEVQSHFVDPQNTFSILGI